MKKTITQTLLASGYLALALCAAPQWIQTFITRDARGLSLPFLAAFAGGLAVLQIAFRLARPGRIIELGNLAGLSNALMMLAAYFWAA